jgi:predicted P-loop ATPase
VLAETELDKRMRDRMQLWAEAAHQQSQGESLTLDRSLWAAAAVEQEARRVRDAWEDKLARLPVKTKTKKAPLGVVHLIEGQQRVAAADLLDRVLNLSAVQQTTATAMRLSTVMRVLGWKRAKNGYVVIDGRRVTGYFRDVDA